MPKKLSIVLSPEQLKTLQGRIKKSGLTYVSIARQVKNMMCEASCLKKLRGDTPMSESQLKRFLEIIESAEEQRKLLEKSIQG